MKSATIPLLLAVSLSVSRPLADDDAGVENASFVAPDGSRVLRQSVVVKGSLREVWDAFTTTEGIRGWVAPVAKADFRLGGIWEVSYDRSAKLGDPGNIQNRYIAFVPLRMVAIQAVQCPPGFPFADRMAGIFHVIELEEATGGVRVTISGVGYLADQSFDGVYAHFEKGNAWSLGRLRKRFADGPIDWEKAAPPPSRPR